jgi:hypothetical protein
MFVVVTVFAVWLGWEIDFITRRHTYIHRFQPNTWRIFETPPNPFWSPPPVIPVWRIWLGDCPQAFVAVPSGRTREQLAEVKSLFPEVVIYDQ